MAKRKSKAAGGLDALYGVPLAEFTKKRNALAKRLREDGDRERADEVKALKKPTLPAWAINQAVRADDKAAKALLKSGDDLRSAHERALAGDADDLKVAMGQEADAVEAMTMAAVRAARPEKLAGGMLDRVRDTLRAVAGDQELRAEFLGGRVVTDRKPVGLGGEGGARGGTRTGGKRAKRKRGPTAAQRRKADAKVTKARKALDARRREIAEATKKAETARRTAKEADGRVGKAEDAAAKAQDALDAAEAAREELKD